MDDNNIASNITDDAAATETSYFLTVDPIQYKNQTIITKVVALLSATGSAYISISMIAKACRQKKMERTFDRLLLCVCASDIISSVSFFLGSW